MIFKLATQSCSISVRHAGALNRMRLTRLTESLHPPGAFRPSIEVRPDPEFSLLVKTDRQTYDTRSFRLSLGLVPRQASVAPVTVRSAVQPHFGQEADPGDSENQT